MTEVICSKQFWTHLPHTNLWVFIKLFPDFWHGFGMEGSGEVSETAKHEQLARAINHPLPGTPSDLNSAIRQGLRMPHSLTEAGLGGLHCCSLQQRLSLHASKTALQTRLAWRLLPFLLDWTWWKANAVYSEPPADGIYCSYLLLIWYWGWDQGFS